MSSPSAPSPDPEYLTLETAASFIERLRQLIGDNTYTLFVTRPSGRILRTDCRLNDIGIRGYQNKSVVLRSEPTRFAKQATLIIDHGGDKPSQIEIKHPNEDAIENGFSDPSYLTFTFQGNAALLEYTNPANPAARVHLLFVVNQPAS